MLNISTSELITFVAVVERKSFVIASDALDQPASVTSRHIKSLENKVSSQLLKRTTRSVSLTQAGEDFYHSAQQALKLLNDAQSLLLDKTQGPKGHLKIDAATPFALHALVPLIKGFNAQYPEVTIELLAHESNVNLLQGDVDLAIRIGALSDSNLKARKIGETPRILVASPDYIKQHSVPKQVSDLAKHQLIGFSQSAQLNNWPVLLDGQDFQAKPNSFASSGETIRHLALQGNGIACLSTFVVQKDILKGHLRQVLSVKTQEHKIPIHAVYFSDKNTNLRLRCFIDYLLEHINLY